MADALNVLGQAGIVELVAIAGRVGRLGLMSDFLDGGELLKDQVEFNSLLIAAGKAGAIYYDQYEW
ncbi:hypothetical protein D3C80_1955020 [compost metagenome]